MPLWKYIAALAIAIFLGLFLYNLVGCGPSTINGAESTLRSALDAIGDTVAPTSQLARKVCLDRMEAEKEQVKAGKQTTSQAEEKIRAIEERCDVLRDTFAQIRIAHSEATDMVEAEVWTQATAKLEEIKQKLAKLREMGVLP